MSNSVGREILFEVGDYLLAADAGEVRGVGEPVEATPVPCAAPGVLGLVNLRGTVVVAAELATLLGLAPERGPERALVVIERDGRRLALEVDRLSGVTAAGPEEADVDAETLAALGARDLVASVARLGSRPYLRIDVGALLTRVLDDEGGDGRPGSIGSAAEWER